MDEAEQVRYFAATIGGKIYSGILDCVEKIVTAVTWVYNAVKIAIEDIIEFIEFLFGWQDILTTHRVMKNVSVLMARYSIDQLQTSKDDLDSLVTQLQAMIGKWTDLPGQVNQLVDRFIGIVYDAVIAEAEGVIDALIDALLQTAEKALDLFTAKIDIPVLSWLYKELSGDDLTFLDLLCLIAAIPVTLVYKAATDKAPFPKDDAFTKGLLAAKSFADIQKLFVAQPNGTAVVGAAATPVLDEDKLKTFAVVSGVAALSMRRPAVGRRRSTTC